MYNFAENAKKNLERVPVELQGDYKTWIIQQFKTRQVVDKFNFKQATWLLEVLTEMGYDAPVEWYELAEECLWPTGSSVWSEVERQKGMDALTKAVKKKWAEGERLCFVVFPEWLESMTHLRPNPTLEEVRDRLMKELGL